MQLAITTSQSLVVKHSNQQFCNWLGCSYMALQAIVMDLLKV